MSGQHATLAHKAAEEFKAMLALAAYLYVGLGALLLERTALLHAEGISYAAWGGAAVKALVLAKFMLIGHALHLGESYRHKPLIWPTLHMGLMFLILLLSHNVGGGACWSNSWQSFGRFADPRRRTHILSGIGR